MEATFKDGGTYNIWLINVCREVFQMNSLIILIPKAVTFIHITEITKHVFYYKGASIFNSKLFRLILVFFKSFKFFNGNFT